MHWEELIASSFEFKGRKRQTTRIFAVCAARLALPEENGAIDEVNVNWFVSEGDDGGLNSIAWLFGEDEGLSPPKAGTAILDFDLWMGPAFLAPKAENSEFLRSKLLLISFSELLLIIFKP